MTPKNKKGKRAPKRRRLTRKPSVKAPAKIRKAPAKIRKPRIGSQIWYAHRFEHEAHFYQIWFRGEGMLKWKHVSQVSPSKMHCSLEEAEELAKTIFKAAQGGWLTERKADLREMSEADLREMCKLAMDEWANVRARAD